MNDQSLRNINYLSNVAWKKYKDWAQRLPEKRDDVYWDIVTKEINTLVKGEKQNPEFLKKLLLAYAEQLDEERAEACEQQRLNL